MFIINIGRHIHNKLVHCIMLQITILVHYNQSPIVLTLATTPYNFIETNKTIWISLMITINLHYVTILQLCHMLLPHYISTIHYIVVMTTQSILAMKTML